MRHQHATDTLAAERYLLDEMTEQERYEFEAHYFECDECAELVRMGAAMAAGVRAERSIRMAAASPPAAAPRWRPATVIPLAAAAALALVAGYQALVTIPALRDRGSPRAVRTVALAPASRGDAAVIPAATAREGVTLMVDVNGVADNGALGFDLAGPGNKSRLSGTADAPAPGLPLVIWLPPDYLTSGEYQLTIQTSTPPARNVGQYRFVVR